MGSRHLEAEVSLHPWRSAQVSVCQKVSRNNAFEAEEDVNSMALR